MLSNFFRYFWWRIFQSINAVKIIQKFWKNGSRDGGCSLFVFQFSIFIHKRMNLFSKTENPKFHSIAFGRYYEWVIYWLDIKLRYRQLCLLTGIRTALLLGNGNPPILLSPVILSGKRQSMKAAKLKMVNIVKAFHRFVIL